jgi:ATP/maltotriose-dependent transcriptional regulator MalT
LGEDVPSVAQAPPPAVPDAALPPASSAPTEADVRRWLSLLRQPDRLAEPDLAALLRARGRLPAAGSPIAVGQAARDMLVQAIDGLRPDGTGPKQQELPYLVLKTCFVDGAKHVSAAERLGMSPRQLTRERARAIRLLSAELTAATTAPADAPTAYRAEPIPAIASFLPRPGVSRTIAELLAQHHLVHVHGPKGIGKTSLVAELAADTARRTPVFWYRFRAGLNTTFGAFSFELAEYLRSQGRPALAEYIAEALPNPDLGIVGRLAIRDLTATSQLVVLDDCHVADDDSAVFGFAEEAVVRLPELRVVTVGRHRDASLRVGTAYALPAMTRLETQSLLAQLGVRTSPMMAEMVHAWTEGLPHLVTLAASWLKSAAPDEIGAGIEALTQQHEVQEFLLSAISELLDSADRAILDAASVFRDRFTDESVAFVADQTVGVVQDTSRRLVRRHLASRSRAGDVAFFHASVREWFYARLTPERRREVHLRAAEWYALQANKGETAYHTSRAEG